MFWQGHFQGQLQLTKLGTVPGQHRHLVTLCKKKKKKNEVGSQSLMQSRAFGRLVWAFALWLNIQDIQRRETPSPWWTNSYLTNTSWLRLSPWRDRHMWTVVIVVPIIIPSHNGLLHMKDK